MFPGGEFRDDAAILRMKLDLRRDYAGKDGAVANDSDAGFVAGGFDGSEEHLVSIVLKARQQTPTNFVSELDRGAGAGGWEGLLTSSPTWFLASLAHHLAED